MNLSKPIDAIPALVNAADRAQATTAAMWRAASNINATPMDVLAAVTGIFCVLLEELPEQKRRETLAAILNTVESHCFGQNAIHLPTQLDLPLPQK